MDKIKVLFVCVHNSARSQMAEAYLKRFGGDMFEVESAGLEPGELNPFVVEVMKEEGIDISGNRTKSVFDLFKQGRMFGYVVAVCDKEAAERCPIFPGVSTRMNWSFADPSALTGSNEERLAGTRAIRDQIKETIAEWVRAIRAGLPAEAGSR
jgi:arsenate reductase (thioredoxin)